MDSGNNKNLTHFPPQDKNDKESPPDEKLDTESETADTSDTPFAEHEEEPKSEGIAHPNQQWHEARDLEIEKPDSISPARRRALNPSLSR